MVILWLLRSYGMCVVLLCGSICAGLGSASARVIRSVGSGAWSDLSVWSAGSVPDQGDTVIVSAPDTVRVIGQMQTRAHSILVERNAVVEIVAGSLLSRASGSSPAPWFRVDGSLHLHGTLGATSEAASANEDELLLIVSPAGRLNLRGEPGQQTSVLSVEADADNTLVVELEDDDATMTHLRVESGWYPGTTYRILDRPGPRRLRLSAGALGGRREIASAGADSIVVPLREGEIPEQFIGAVALSHGGEGFLVEAALPSAAGAFATLYLEREWLSSASADSVDLIEALVPGTSVRLARLARVIGSAEPPTSIGEGSAILVAGTVDAAWFEIANTSHRQAAIRVYANAPVAFDHGWLHDFFSKYQIVLEESYNDAPPQQFDWSSLYLENARGIDDGDWGHGILFDDARREQGLTLRYCSARRTLDDFIFARQGAQLSILDARATQSTSGNLVDASNLSDGMQIVVRRCRVLGYGENVIRADEGQVAWDLSDNFMSQSGWSLNRDTVGGHTTGIGSGSGMRITSVASFVSHRDTIQWSSVRGVDVSCVGPARIRFMQTVFHANGVWRVWPSVEPIPLELFQTAPIGPGRTDGSAIELVGTQFIDNPRRGLNAGALGGGVHAQAVLGLAGQWLLEDVSTTSLHAAEVSSVQSIPDIHARGSSTLLRIEGGIFQNEGAAIYAANEASVALERSIVLTRAGSSVVAEGQIDAQFSTFWCESTQPTVQVATTGARFVANLFLRPDGDAPFLAFADEVDTAQTALEWNVYATSAPNAIQIAGVSVPWPTWSENHDSRSLAIEDDSQAWREHVAGSQALTMLENSPARDLVHDPRFGTDPDGTWPDPGALPAFGVPVSNPLAPILTRLTIRAWPNPFDGRLQIGYEASHSSTPVIEIFDLRGRHIRSLQVRALGAGGITVWDGRDENGSTVAQGVYLIQLHDGAHATCTKVMRIR